MRLGILPAVAALALALTACGDDGDPDGDSAGSTSATPSGPAGAIERGASAADFCGVAEEIDDSIDVALARSEAGEDATDDWQRVVDAFDALVETGVPDDLGGDGLAELEHVRTIVDASGSIEEFGAAIEQDPPPQDAIDDYLDDTCD